MGYLPDTNIVSAFINNIGEIHNKLNTVTREGEDTSLSVITHYEIRRGTVGGQCNPENENF